LLLTSPLYYWLASRDSHYRRRQAGASVVRRTAPTMSVSKADS